MKDVCLTSPVSVQNPRWSPDGEKITFTSVFDGIHQVFVIDVGKLTDTLHTPVMQIITDPSERIRWRSASVIK